MDIFTEHLIKLGMSVLVGGMIGAEREFQDKAAGFRTIILITLGSTLFTMFSMSMDPDSSRTRIAANIVTGIGFLGAGAIVREGGKIGGLTTAATIWLSAALGMGIGAGEIWLSVAASAVTLVVLLVFPHAEGWIDHIRESRTYKIELKSKDVKKIEKIGQVLQECSLRVYEKHQAKTDKSIIVTWKVIGPPKGHEQFIQMMLKDKDVEEFDY